MNSRRRFVKHVSTLLLSCTLFGCKKGISMESAVVLDVVLFNYIDRAIIDVLLNGEDIGVAGPYGGGSGVLSGVRIPLGAQRLTWRWDGPEGMPGNGDTVAAINTMTLSPTQISADDRYLGVHVYPDRTAELTLSPHLPEMTPKGEQIYREKRRNDR
jgi:hypothetical protein